MNPNMPVWQPNHPKIKGAFQEVWFLKLNDPVSQRALWLRFTLLISANGFRRTAEVWAILFQRQANREVVKLGLKQSFDLDAFSYSRENGIRIGECAFSDGRTKGVLQAKGNTFEWDLEITPKQRSQFSFVPDFLLRTGILRVSATTVEEDLAFSGKTAFNGEALQWAGAKGMQGHLSGPRNGHSWIWAHCNSFVNDQGVPASFIFEGLSARAWLVGSLPTPRLSSFFFLYQEQPYKFNSLWDLLRLRSKNSHNEWWFRADRGELSFRGQASAELKDFAGLTYEDTNGSFLYCANSKLSDLRIQVYRRGKLEASFNSQGTTALEIVTRSKNPYVPLLI